MENNTLSKLKNSIILIVIFLFCCFLHIYGATPFTVLHSLQFQYAPAWLVGMLLALILIKTRGLKDYLFNGPTLFYSIPSFLFVGVAGFAPYRNVLAFDEVIKYGPVSTFFWFPAKDTIAFEIYNNPQKWPFDLVFGYIIKTEEYVACPIGFLFLSISEFFFGFSIACIVFIGIKLKQNGNVKDFFKFKKRHLIGLFIPFIFSLSDTISISIQYLVLNTTNMSLRSGIENTWILLISFFAFWMITKKIKIYKTVGVLTTLAFVIFEAPWYFESSSFAFGNLMRRLFSYTRNSFEMQLSSIPFHSSFLIVFSLVLVISIRSFFSQKSPEE